ncbi:MAG: Gfo/Idh/MocA family oxidoreductase [Clostridia bacterium]|nr:Gfo/Idh/MocA family oxidoreductase [Clostridia bacterium]
MNVAVLGTWHVHAPEYTESVIDSGRATLVKVWDADIEKAKAFGEKYNTAYTSDLNEILSDESIDSVVITTSTKDHPEVITAVAKAGKNIFTEKVLAFDVAEAEEMKKVIDESGVKFTISYPQRTWGSLRFVKGLVEGGKLGTVTYARERNVHDGASAGWLPPHFYDKSQTGGGAMMDLGAHPMYNMLYILGEPEYVSSAFTTVTGKPVEDNSVSVLSYANGAIGVSETGFVSKNNPMTLEVSGTEGAVMVHGTSVTYCCADTDNKWVDAEVPENEKLPIYQWIDAVCDGTEAPFGTADAVALTKIMDAAYRSAESGAKAKY